MSNKGELVTVIIPVYNASAWLNEAIESVLAQTYENIELILVDDGSDDGSDVICENYSNKDDRIIVLHQDNHGQGSARNYAIEQSQGEYLCFLDADDLMSPIMIETLLQVIREYGLDIAASGYSTTGQDNGENDSVIDGAYETAVYTSTEAIALMWYDTGLSVAPWAKLYKRQVWKTERFSECYGEDLATMHRVLGNCSKVGVIDARLYYYRLRSGSSDWGYSEKQSGLLEIAEQNLEYAYANNLELVAPARSKLVAVSYHLLTLLLDTGVQDEAIELHAHRLIKMHRWFVATDVNARRKTRIACLLSYMGVNTPVRLYRIINSKGRRPGRRASDL